MAVPHSQKKSSLSCSPPPDWSPFCAFEYWFAPREEFAVASATTCWRSRSNREMRVLAALNLYTPSCAYEVRLWSAAETSEAVGIGACGSLTTEEPRSSYLD